MIDRGWKAAPTDFDHGLEHWSGGVLTILDCGLRIWDCGFKKAEGMEIKREREEHCGFGNADRRLRIVDCASWLLTTGY
jgi:hypothetical protein